MIGVMTKPSRKKPDSKRTRGVDRHTQPRLAFHLPKDLYDAFKGHVDSLRPKPNESSVLRLALELYLERAGCWPPKERNPNTA
jgi:hypothetical protein